jgi:hypothetical protein
LSSGRINGSCGAAAGAPTGATAGDVCPSGGAARPRRRRRHPRAHGRHDHGGSAFAARHARLGLGLQRLDLRAQLVVLLEQTRRRRVLLAQIDAHAIHRLAADRRRRPERAVRLVGGQTEVVPQAQFEQAVDLGAVLLQLPLRALDLGLPALALLVLRRRAGREQRRGGHRQQAGDERVHRRIPR